MIISGTISRNPLNNSELEILNEVLGVYSLDSYAEIRDIKAMDFWARTNDPQELYREIVKQGLALSSELTVPSSRIKMAQVEK
ncbi:hypothetical protein CO038_03505 [Candidatus Pacearchaeota archaeon CG_4_9_14_0_2_um_filter_39_13]|nr:hypothetical protein [Candidatus Pacearchaeota archaeon]OIO43602.1 MAG: hypothetical protein AUJ64_01990 [Candidatus Pacearchaeota archaeon CG1_02_39_14]PJC44484.1 MAG: hypothetical protein CO038_03505 [Candidatus Pacearchaeota archaeon CG_4_9_14_0_2_um_filter_39_13]